MHEEQAIRWTRRGFLQGTVAAALYTGLPGAAIGATASPLAGDARRPQFHLLPTHNWMNDPNGPIYFNGKYHMFFQYNPQAAVWGNMSWNHAVSNDMVHWRNYPVAFTMTPGGPDEAGCFSGSTIVKTVAGKPRVYALYTGVVRDKEHETIRNEGLRESQCLAWSDDPLLRRWTKLDMPVIPAPPPGLKAVGFRDPAVWEQNGTFYMTVGSGMEEVGGCLLLYRSTDLEHWEYMHPMAKGVWNGKRTSNPVDDGEMWECPEIFPLGGRHVLIYSTLRKVYWQSGVLDAASMTFKQQKNGMLDLGTFYAPKTQLDAQGRRVLWGWIPERRSSEEMAKAGWSGLLSLPRVLSLDSNGSLRMSFLPTLQMLRRQPLAVRNLKDQSTVALPRATGELVCQGQRNTAWSLKIRLPGGDPLELRYNPDRHAFLCETDEIVLEAGDLPSLHAFVDGSVLEIIVAQRQSLTRRFYYQGDAAPDISVAIQGGGTEVRAWPVSSISPDRLTSASL